MLGRREAAAWRPSLGAHDQEVRMAVHSPTPSGSGGARGPRPALVDAALRLEHTKSLDRLVERLAPVGAALIRNPKVADVLHGKAMGHAAHPLLTDVPIGTWTSAFVLDLIGGKKSRPAARRLIGTGILAAVPTAVTGLAEWAATPDQAARRVGAVHAVGNNVALMLYVLSYRARRRGHHARGFLVSLAGLGIVGASGFLGAHLSLARKVATRHEEFAEQVPLGGDAVTAAGDPTALGDSEGPGESTGTGRHRDETADPSTTI
jgi:uncharacterized membrane protein